MKTKILAMCVIGMALQAQAATPQNLDLSSNLADTSVSMSHSKDGILEVLIPAGDDVSVDVVQDDAGGGCKSLGISNGGMVWTVDLQMQKMGQAESCTFKVTEDGQSALITLY